MTKINKKIVSLFLVAMLCFSAIIPFPIFAANNIMQFVDECNDLSKIFSQSGALEVFTDGSPLYEQDMGTIGRGVSARTAGMIQNMVYKITGKITGFEVVGHYNKTSSDLLTFYVSSNGINYTQITTDGEMVERSDGWEYVLHTSNNIPDGTSYLKIQFNGEQTDRNWDGRVGKVIINYEPDLSLPGMAVYTPDYYDITPTDVKDTEYASYVNFVLGIGILNKNEDGLFKPDESINRNDFALGVCRLFGFAPLSWEENQVDVSESVDILKSNGAYKNITSTSDTVTYEEAIRILVDSLGYGNTLTKDTDSAYASSAAKIGLTNNFKKITSEKPLTRGQAAILLKNASETSIMMQTGFGESEIYQVQKNVTPLNEYLNVYSATGVVTANRATALTYNEVLIGKDEVEIDGVIYKTGNTQAATMLGYNVEYFYKEIRNDKDILVYTIPDESMEIVEFDSEDIENITQSSRLKTTIEFYSKDKNKTRKITLGVANMIYNGKFCGFDIEKLRVPETRIRILSDGSNKYNTVFVTHYDVHAVDRIALSEYTIHSKYRNNAQLRFDPYDGNREFFFAKDGKTISLDDIKPWDILSIEESTGDDGFIYSRVWVSDKKITGTIEAIKTDANGHIDAVVINDKEYKVTDDYLNAAASVTVSGKAPRIELGAEGTFYLDIWDSIAAFDEEETREGYAYLKEAYEDFENKNSISFRMFTNNGEWITVRNNSKSKYIYINDNKVDSDNVITNLKASSLVADSTAQVIKYRISKENELKRIYTATNFVANPDAIKEETAINNGTLRYSKYMTRAGYKYDNSSLYDSVNQNTEGRLPVFVSDNTMILSVPKNDRDDESKYCLKKKNSFVDGMSYEEVEFYDIDKFGHAGLVVLKDGDSASIYPSSARYIVKNVTNAINKNGEDVYKLYLFSGSRELEYLTAPDAKIVKKVNGNEAASSASKFSINDISPGDTIQFVEDRFNDIRAIYRWGNIKDVYNGIINNNPAKSLITNENNKRGEFALMNGVVKEIDLNRGYFNVLTKTDAERVVANTAIKLNVYILTYRNGKPYSIENKTLADVVYDDKVAIDLKFMTAINLVVVRDC